MSAERFVPGFSRHAGAISSRTAALRNLQGRDSYAQVMVAPPMTAGLSPTAIARLVKTWEAEYTAVRRRDLPDRDVDDPAQ